MTFDNIRCIDKLKLCRIKNGVIQDPDIETNNNPSLWQRILMWLDLYKCAGDAFTNYMINQLAVYTAGKLLYASVGTTGTGGSTYTYSDLIAPVMTREAATISYVSTYNTDPTYPDTVRYTIVMEATGDYDLKEAGLHTAATVGYMGSRQTFPAWAVTNGESFAMVWDIIYGRG